MVLARLSLIEALILVVIIGAALMVGLVALRNRPTGRD